MDWDGNTTKTDIVDMVDFSAIEAILNLAKKTVNKLYLYYGHPGNPAQSSNHERPQHNQ